LFGEFDGVSPGDPLWIAGYPLVAAGLIRMVRLRAPGRLREALLAVAGATFSVEVVAAAFYPFGDVLLFAAAAMLVLAPGDRHGPTGYLIVALTLTFAGDVVISVVSAVWPDVDTGRFDAVLLLANALLVAALRHPRADRLTTAHVTGERLHPARVVFLGVALLAMPALAELRTSATAAQKWASLAAMATLSVIVLIRFTLVVRDQERVRADLAYRAAHDRMTGLVNRPELHTRLEAALRSGRPGLLVVLDLDGFEPINDRYGHAAGDAVLVEIAARLRAAVRPGDTVARVGGDEFVVVPGDAHGPESAAALADRLDRLVRAPIRYGSGTLTVGVSIGSAFAADLAHPDADAPLAAADAGMYRAKAARRTAAPVS
jgi:diguanylate cyclase (GGDEF)-like protein